MLKNKCLLVGLVLIAATVFSACSVPQFGPSELSPNPSLEPQSATFTDRQKVILRVGDSEPMEVEVVTSPESITQGLSGREELGADGMLFITDWEGPVRFWMKDMKFDLDMVWIHDNTVVEITEDVPAPKPGTPLNKLPKYSAQLPVNKVLELNAGDAEKWGIEVGDRLRFE